MIYELSMPNEGLLQGDLIDGCPIVYWDLQLSSVEPVSDSTDVRVLVLTQSCDLEQLKTNRILVAVVHAVRDLVSGGTLTPKMVREQIRNHKVYGWYFLPAGPGMEESIVDLRDLHTIPRSMLSSLIQQGKRVARITTPYRKHLAQHFAVTYSRIGLPEPYSTQPDA